MKEEYKLWVDEVAKLFGGLDILALDVLHGKDGRDYIIEVNDTAPGLMYEHEEEDIGHIRDLVLQRINAAYQS
jgi:glutathione synthase/RimK-type ligase-like ATP-grasp enzyme